MLFLFFAIPAFGALMNIPPPQKLSPSPNEPDVPMSRSLSWQEAVGASEGNSYHYLIWLASNNQLIKDDVTTLITTPSLTELNLSPGTTYSWDVESCWPRERIGDWYFGRECGDSNNKWLFTTQGTNPSKLSAPEKISPWDEEVSSPVTFRWNSATGADKYQIVVWLGGTQEAASDKLTAPDTQKVFNLDSGKPYTWNVKSCHKTGWLWFQDDCGEQEFGLLFNFTTKATTPTELTITSLNNLPDAYVGQKDYYVKLESNCGNNCFWIQRSRTTPISDPEDKFRLPRNLTLDTSMGVIQGEITEPLTQAKTFEPYIEVRYADKPDQFGVTKKFFLTVQPAGAPPQSPKPQITSTSPLRGGTVGLQYTYLFEATSSNPSPQFDWFWGNRRIPEFNLTTTGEGKGQLVGTTNVPMLYEFDVCVRDKVNLAAGSDCRAFSLTISSATTMQISPSTLSEGKVGQAYNQTISVAGGISSYDWEIIGAKPPSWLKYQFSTGTKNQMIFSGTPTNADVGTFRLYVEVKDSAVPQGTTFADYWVKINPEIGAGAGVPGPIGATSVEPKCEGQSTTLKNPKVYSTYEDANKNNRYDTGEKTHPVAYDGLVPCGKCVLIDPQNANGILSLSNGITQGGNLKYVSCQFCHFFVMFKGIVDWVVGVLVPVIAVLMLIIGGLMFFFGGTNPQMLLTGKNIIKSVIWGLIIVYGAWLITSTILSMIGAQEWTGLVSGWWKSTCMPTYSP